MQACWLLQCAGAAGTLHQVAFCASMQLDTRGGGFAVCVWRTSIFVFTTRSALTHTSRANQRFAISVSYRIDPYDGEVLEGRTIAIKYGNQAWWLAEVIHEHIGPEHTHSHES